MRQFMMTIMALTAFGALMATAQADDVHGGPMRNATASGTLAATKSHSVGLSRDAYMSYNRDAAYLGTDPDRNIRFELNRDRTHRVGQ
jgi:hypothetical protein